MAIGPKLRLFLETGAHETCDAAKSTRKDLKKAIYRSPFDSCNNAAFGITSTLKTMVSVARWSKLSYSIIGKLN